VETRTAIEAWSAGADWIIVDHYGLDGGWEAAMRSHARHVFVIDDLADRHHHCDLLLDQNFYDDPLRRYDGKIDPHCRTLMGPEYALLRDEFRLARSSLGCRSGRISRVLIAFGGADMGNETAKAIEAFRSVTDPALTGIVVTGVLNPHHAEIERLCGNGHRLVLRQQVRDIARCMAEADLAIGAGGAMSWERCCVGLPSIVIAIAANQEPIAESLSRRGACWYLGPAERVRALDIVQCIEGCIKDPTAVRRVSKAATALSPGDGTRKVCDVLMQLSGYSS
jgi:UDP-2,4-diacetamido-2,4,6-trideoxy-beta-L-altropyranose hydrolase